MYPVSNELKLLLKDNAAAKVITSWLYDKRQDAKDSYEQLVQAAMFDDSKLSNMRIAYGRFTVIDELYNEAIDISSINTGA